jgi:hypothetical protein
MTVNLNKKCQYGILFWRFGHFMRLVRGLIRISQMKIISS